MELHDSKFECLRYGTTPICSHHLTTCKSNTGSTITGETSVKELCVQISKDATFKKHIQNVIDSANNQCSWIQRTFQTRHAQAMLTLWKSLVLCKLDYCSQLWCPSEKGDIQSLEMVHCSFLRKRKGQGNLSYWDQLHLLRLYPLKRRRERYFIIYVWRILKAQVPNPSGKYAITANTHSPSTRMYHSASQQHCSTEDSDTAICQALQHHKMLSGCFKGQLDKFLLTVTDEPQITGCTAQRRAKSNSLLDVACHAHTRNRMEVLSGNPSAMKVALPALPWHSGVKTSNTLTR